MAEGRHFASDNNQNVQAPRPVVPKSRQGHNRPTRTSVDARRPRSNKPARKRITPRVAVTCALAGALGIAGVAGVVAWLTAESNVQNQFVLSEVKPVVNEDGNQEGSRFENETSTVKQNVSVSNKGNVPIYVRAKINIYWADVNGNQLWDEPEPEPKESATGIIAGDYRLDMGTIGENFVQGTWLVGQDGYYYWSLPLAPQSAEGDTPKTGNLIDKLERINSNLHKDGRKLVCDVSVQGIQADPARAVEEAWNVKVEDGVIAGAANGQGA